MHMEPEQNFEKQRIAMTEEQIARRGVRDPHLLSAFQAVPRHKFVPEVLQSRAYADGALPIGEEQTISQPYIVALMTLAAQVNAESTVLEIGTGSGYQAAILATLVKKVYSIERVPALALRAKDTLQALGYQNIEIKVGDGSLGWPEKGPYDAILVTAGAPIVPESLKKQLKAGGSLIIPVGSAYSQSLLRVTKDQKGEFHQTTIESVRFVPLIGEEGWQVP